MGGGVCQTATGVYRVALNAGFKIIERHKHVYGAIYAPKGDDAAVDWDAKWDLKFKTFLLMRLSFALIRHRIIKLLL
ncbi:VanW family protein [Thermoanaerobacter sp. AC272]|nr:VanW family protein [Thermoanaerobacter sp. CM-CNRG TB177]